MNIALRILVFLVLIINAISLWFSADLYKKRELLKGRGELYKDQLVKISKTLEAEDPVDPASPAVYPARDIAAVTDQLQESPETDTFWNSYVQKYEIPNLPTMSIDSTDAQRIQLNAYYRTQIDENGKIVPATDAMGNYITEGQGTAREVLEKVFDRAKAQNALLNKTREQLTKVREELVVVITDHNKLKQDGRQDKKTITEKNAEIEKQKAEIAEKQDKINLLEQRRKEIESELSDAKAEVQEKQEQIETQETELAKRQEALQAALAEIKRLKQDPSSGVAGGATIAAMRITAGVKGEIVKVDNQYLFAVIKLSDEAMKELVGEQMDAPLPAVDLHVKRPGYKGPAGEYVARIRLKKSFSKKDGDSHLIVADILSDWKQADLEVKDVVFY